MGGGSSKLLYNNSFFFFFQKLLCVSSLGLLLYDPRHEKSYFCICENKGTDLLCRG